MTNATRSLVLGILLLCLTAAIGARQPTGLSFTLKPLGPNVWAAIDSRNEKAPAAANAGFVIGDDGVIVIDTFASSEAARQLLAEIRKLTKLPVKFAVNTHYHGDHVAGNKVFLEAGAALLAHRNVRAWIYPENAKFFGKEIKPEQKAFLDALVPPTVGFDQAIDLYLGSREIQIRSFPGHTGGDSVVLIPDAKVAFGGDLFWRNTSPNTIDASTKAWIATLDTLAKTFPDYTFIPGHGDVGTAQDVTAFRDYLATLQKLVSDERGQGKTGDALVEAVISALAAKYGQWDFFKFLAPLNVREMEAELSGAKRIPKAQ
jgi:cyclase